MYFRSLPGAEGGGKVDARGRCPRFWNLELLQIFAGSFMWLSLGERGCNVKHEAHQPHYTDLDE